MRKAFFALLLWVVTTVRADQPVAKFGSLAAGAPAPDFTVVGSDGKELKLSDFHGRTVILNFWAPNRGPAEALQSAFLTYGEMDVVVLGIGSSATRAEFDGWVAKAKDRVTYLLAWDPAGKTPNAAIAQRNFGVGVYPLTGVIDRSGKIVGGFVGFGAQSGGVLRDYLRAAGLPIPPDEKPASPAAAPEPESTTLSLGTPAPDFITVDLGGKPVKLSDFAGKIVVLDFWATWCGPCLASLPHTQKVAAATKAQGVVVLASCTSDTRERFEAWMKENAAKYPDLGFSHDAAAQKPERASAKAYGVRGIPTTFVIGRDGKVAEAFSGYGEGDTRLEEALAKLVPPP